MTLIHLCVNDTTDWGSGKQRRRTGDDIFTGPAILQPLPVFPLIRSANSKSMGFFCFCRFRHPHCVLSAARCVCVNRFEFAIRMENVFFYLMRGCETLQGSEYFKRRHSRLISEGSSWFTNMRSASATFANIFAAQSKKTSKLKVGALNSPPGSYPSLKGPTQTRLGPPRGSRWTWVKAAGRTTEIKRLQNAGETPPPVGPCVSRRAVICHLGSHFGGGHIPQCPARQGATVPVAAH